MDQTPKLHVVYSERGDALYVEYTHPELGDQRLACLDGGPATMGLKAGDIGDHKRPYWRFYLSAGKMIWKKMARADLDTKQFNPSAILNTHLHADHIQGLYGLLQKRKDPHVLLNAPFIFPAYMTQPNAPKKGKQPGLDGRPKAPRDDVHVNAFYRTLFEALDFREMKSDSRALENYLKGLTIEYPPNIAALNLKTEPKTEEDEKNFDSLFTALDGAYSKEDLRIENVKTDLNLSSILLHVPATPDYAKEAPQPGGIFTTGDNTANLIYKYVIPKEGVLETEEPTVKHYSIYKISHHGSKKDNQLWKGNEQKSIPTNVHSETALFATLAFHNRAYAKHEVVLMAKRLRCRQADVAEGTENLVMWFREFGRNIKMKNEANSTGLKQQQQQQPFTDSEITAILEVLDERHSTYLKDAHNPKYLNELNFKMDSGEKCSFQPAEEWLGLVKMVMTHRSQVRRLVKKDDEQTQKVPRLFWSHGPPAFSRILSRESDEYEVTDSLDESSDSDDTDIEAIIKEKGELVSDHGNDKGDSEEMIEKREKAHAMMDRPQPIDGITYNEVNNCGDADKKWWWANWTGVEEDDVGGAGVWAHYYLRLAITDRICEFFTTFTADAYIVSANHANGHPSPETVLGLAQALKKQSRKATLYLTSGSSFDARKFYRLAKMKGCNAENLFEKHLEIRYLAEGHILSLSGEPKTVIGSCEDLVADGMQVPPSTSRNLLLQADPGAASQYPSGLHDIRNVTKEITYPVTARIDKAIEELWTSMEDRKLFLAVPKKYTETIVEEFTSWWYTIRLQDGSANWVSVVGSQNKVELRLETAETPVMVEEGWALGQRLYEGVALSAGARPPKRLWVKTKLDPYQTGTFALEWEVDKGQQRDIHTFYQEVGAGGKDLGGPVIGPINKLDEKDNQGENMNYQCFFKFTPCDPPLQTCKLLVTDSMALVQRPAGQAIQKQATLTSTATASNSLIRLVESPLLQVETKLEKVAPALRKKLDKYFEAIQQQNGGDFVAGKSDKTGDLVEALVTKENFDKMKFQNSHEQTVMNSTVNRNSSWVAFTPENPAIGPTAAFLSLEVAKDSETKFPIGDDKLPITQATVGLVWTVNAIYASMVIIAEIRNPEEPLLQSHKLVSTKVISTKKGPSKLAKVLKNMGVSDSDLDAATVPILLSFLQRSARDVHQKLVNSLPSLFLENFVPKLKPDYSKSTAEAENTPTGQIYMKKALISCDLNSISQPLESLVFGLVGLKLEFESLNISLTNVLVGIESMDMIATVKLSFSDEETISAETNTPISAEMSASIRYKQFVELRFLVNKFQSFGEFIKQIPGLTSLNDISLPFSSSKFRDLDFLPNDFGFAIRQLVPISHEYELERVFAATGLATWGDQWKRMLPFSLPEDFSEHIVRVAVIKPLSDDRTVEVNIQFGVDVPRRGKEDNKHLTAVFSAKPLVLPDDYEYRLDMDAAYHGLSLEDVLVFVGIKDPVADVSGEIPVLSDVVQSLQVRRLSVAMASPEGKWEVSDWSLALWLAKLDLIPNRLSIIDVDLSLLNYGWSMECNGRGWARLGSGGKAIEVAMRLPSKTIPGELRVISFDNLSLADVLEAFDLDRMESDPILKQVLNAKLRSAKFTIGYNTPEGKTISIQGFSIKLRHPLIDLGVIKLEEMDLDFSYFALSTPARKLVNLKGSFRQIPLMVNLDYDSEEGTVVGSLRPVDTTTISRLLTSAIHDDPPGSELIKRIFENLALDHAMIRLNANDKFSFSEARLHVVDTPDVMVEGLVMRKMTAIYVITEAEQSMKATEKMNGTTKENGDLGLLPAKDGAGNSSIRPLKAEPAGQKATTLELMFYATIQKLEVKAIIEIKASSSNNINSIAASIRSAGGDSFVLSGFLDLVGLGSLPIVCLKPEECPEFLKAKVDAVSAELSARESEGPIKSLELQKFQATAHSVGKLSVVASPAIEISDIFLKLKYDKSLGKSKLSGVICGNFSIGCLRLRMEYGKPRATGFAEFYAKRTLEEIIKEDKGKAAQNSVESIKSPEGAKSAVKLCIDDLAKAAAFTNTGGGQLALPKPLESDIGIYYVEAYVCFGPAKSIEIWGKGNESWSGECCGLKFKLEQLKAMVRFEQGKIKNESKQPDFYDAFVEGSLMLKGYICAGARLSIISKSGGNLTARLQHPSKLQNDTKIIQDVTNEITGSKIGSIRSWDYMVPPFNIPVVLKDSQIYIHANLKTSKLLLAMTILGLGSALLLGKKIVKGCEESSEYIFFFEATNLSSIWPELDSDISSQFSISRVAVQVISYEATIKDLKDDMEISANDVEPGKQAINVSKELFKTVGTLHETTPFPAGAWFFAEIKLGKNPAAHMENIIGLDVSANPEPSIVLFAMHSKEENRDPDRSDSGNSLLQKEDAKNPRYYIIIRNFQIFDGVVTLNSGQGRYYPTKKRIETKAELELKLDDNSKQVVGFDVVLEMGENGTSFKGDAKSTSLRPITNPFDKMFNVSLTPRKIDGSATRQGRSVQRSCRIEGTARLGVVRQSDFPGDIYFKGGKPVLVAFKYGETIRITDVYADLIQPNSPSGDLKKWPVEQYGDFVLNEPYVGFNCGTTEISFEKRQYLPGYYIYGRFELFQRQIAVSLKLSESQNGFKMSGVYEGTIDLGILKLERFKELNDSASGPRISIEATGSDVKYEIKTGLRLFDYPGFIMSLQCMPSKNGGQHFKGGVKFSEKFQALDSLEIREINVTYEKGNWSLSDWNFSLKAFFNNGGQGRQIDIFKAIEVGSKKNSECKELVGFKFKERVETEFNFSLSLPEKPQQPMQKDMTVTSNSRVFEFTVDSSFTLRADGKLVAEKVRLANRTFGFPLDSPDFSLKGFITELWGSVTNSNGLEEIGEKIVEDRVVLAKLIEAIAIDELKEEVITRLLCRKPKSPKLEDRAMQILKGKIDGVSKDADKREKEFREIAEGKNPGKCKCGGTTLGILIHVFFLCVGDLSKLKSDINGFPYEIGKMLIRLCPDLNGKIDELKERGRGILRRVNEAMARAREHLQLLLNLQKGTGIELRYLESDKEEQSIYISWENALQPELVVANAEYENIQWQIYISINDDNRLVQPTQLVDGPKKNSTHQNEGYRYASKVHVWIKAMWKTKAGETIIANDWTEASIDHTRWVLPPAWVRLQPKATSFVITVPANEENPADYEIQLVGLSGQDDRPFFERKISSPEIGCVTYEVLFSDLKPNPERRWPSQVRARSRCHWFGDKTVRPSSWVLSNRTVNVLLPPSDLSVVMQGSNIFVSWSPSNAELGGLVKNDGYEIDVRRADTKSAVKLNYSVEVNNNQRSAILSDHQLETGEQVEIAVRSKSVNESAICLYTQKDLTISLPPQFSINGRSYFAVETKRAYLALKLSQPLDPKTKFLLNLNHLQTIGGQSETKPYPVEWRQISEKELLVKTDKIPDAFRGSLQLSMCHADRPDDTAACARTWLFPTNIPPNMSVKNLKCLTENGKVTVRWEGQALGTKVQGRIFDEDGTFEPVTAEAGIETGRLQFDSVIPLGTKVGVGYVVMAHGVRGASHTCAHTV